MITYFLQEKYQSSLEVMQMHGSKPLMARAKVVSRVQSSRASFIYALLVSQMSHFKGSRYNDANDMFSTFKGKI